MKNALFTAYVSIVSVTLVFLWLKGIYAQAGARSSSRPYDKGAWWNLLTVDVGGDQTSGRGENMNRFIMPLLILAVIVVFVVAFLTRA